MATSQCSCAKPAQADVAIRTKAGVRGAFAVSAYRAGEVVAKVLARDSVEIASFDDFTAAVRLHLCSPASLSPTHPTGSA